MPSWVDIDYTLLVPQSQYVQYPPIRRHFLPVTLSLLHFKQDIRVQVHPSIQNVKHMAG